GNQVDGFKNLRVAFQQNARGLRYTEPVIDHFISNQPLQVVLIVLKIFLRELNSTLGEVLLEFAQQSVGNLEGRFDRRILCQEIPDEGIERETAHHQCLERIRLRFLDQVIRSDPAAAINHAADI